jgi:hypothetical protein
MKARHKVTSEEVTAYRFDCLVVKTAWAESDAEPGYVGPAYMVIRKQGRRILTLDQFQEQYECE